MPAYGLRRLNTASAVDKAFQNTYINMENFEISLNTASAVDKGFFY